MHLNTCLHLLTSSLVGNSLNICNGINKQSVKVSTRYIVIVLLTSNLNPSQSQITTKDTI